MKTPPQAIAHAKIAAALSIAAKDIPKGELKDWIDFIGQFHLMASMNILKTVGITESSLFNDEYDALWNQFCGSSASKNKGEEHQDDCSEQ